MALTGGAALAAGLLLGVIVDRLARLGPASSGVLRAVAPAGIRRATPPPPREEAREATDVLERYRAAAAV